ncbi:hypothetical protein RUND412_006746 [Rhizina undulata]
MPVTSEVFSGLCLLALAGAVLLLQRTYLPLRSTPEYLLVATFLPLFVSSSIIVLVPIDLASSNAGEDGSRGVVLHERVLLVAWRIAYWLCFVLTWAILPILQSYSDSGHRSPHNRFLQALRENARYQLLVLTSGAVGLTYFFLTSGVQIYSVKALLMALSYCYALTFAIYLMGHGLVSIPRELIRNASIAGSLRRLQKKAPRVHDQLIEATNNLEEIEQEVLIVRQKRNNAAREFQEWIEELGEMAALPEGARVPLAGNLRGRRSPIPQIITEEYLANLTRRLKIAIHKRARFTSEWENLVQNAADAQAILDSATTKRLTFEKVFAKPSFFDRISLLNPYTRHIAYMYIIPQLRRILATVLSVMSIFIVWSELIHVAAPKLSLVSYTVVHHPGSDRGKIGFAGQVVAAMWIGYMCICAYASLASVKVWGNYALVRRMTSGSSACFYASYAARLTVPLAYNFITFLPAEIAEKSVFYDFLGKLINLTPLGEGFGNFFPILILWPVCATLFNFYGKVQEWFGFGSLDEDDEGEEFGIGGWREGRDLIQREIHGSASSSTVPEYSRTDDSRSRPAASLLRPGIVDANNVILPRHSNTRRARNPRLDDSDSEDNGDEGFFGAWIHRVKNTIDTVETPQWMGGRPRWLRNDPSASRARWAPVYGSGREEEHESLLRR